MQAANGAAGAKLIVFIKIWTDTDAGGTEVPPQPGMGQLTDHCVIENSKGIVETNPSG
jgi:hypothetical protein